MTNFGSEPFPLDTDDVVLTQLAAASAGAVAGATTVWLRRAD